MVRRTTLLDFIDSCTYFTIGRSHALTVKDAMNKLLRDTFPLQQAMSSIITRLLRKQRNADYAASQINQQISP
jgi:hypothetical protein